MEVYTLLFINKKRFKAFSQTQNDFLYMSFVSILGLRGNNIGR